MCGQHFLFFFLVVIHTQQGRMCIIYPRDIVNASCISTYYLQRTKLSLLPIISRSVHTLRLRTKVSTKRNFVLLNRNFYSIIQPTGIFWHHERAKLEIAKDGKLGMIAAAIVGNLRDWFQIRLKRLFLRQPLCIPIHSSECTLLLCYIPCWKRLDRVSATSDLYGLLLK